MKHIPPTPRGDILKLLFLGAAFLPLLGGMGLAAENQPACALVILGNRVEHKASLLAIDDYSLPLKKDLCYYLSKPTVRSEPVLAPSRDNPHATDDLATHFYGTVLHDGGKFRMWYYGASWAGKPGGKIQEGPICYAESPDGIAWTKPNLGQVEHHGGSDNNAIALPDTQTEGAFVVKDESDPDASRRYKMVYENLPGHKRFMSVRTATSEDGIHWTAGPDSPIHEGLEPCAFYQYHGLFYINAQFAPFGVSEGGHRAGRQGFVWVSPDIRHEKVLCPGNGIINVGDETRIYHGRWVNPEDLKDYTAEVALAVLPRDRWGALGLYPRSSEGSVWSAPITFGKAGCKVALNADGVQGMRVEIANERFGLLPEYSGDNAGATAAKDGLDCAVTWPKANLDALTGRTVRLRIRVARGGYAEPRLYAAYISCEN